jgi:D-glycero-D-manno-heptose 1,7-bisphosphate phosphatase
MTPAVFFDRDGTLMEEVGYCGDPALVRVFPGAAAAVARLRAAGFRIVIVTNQSGIGRGYFTESDFHAVQAEFLRQLSEPVDGVYFCPDAPDVSPSKRKPSPEMLLDAARELDLDLAGSFMVGDREGDIQAGNRAGCRSILVLTGYGAADPKHVEYGAAHVAIDLPDAANYIHFASRQLSPDPASTSSGTSN